MIPKSRADSNGILKEGSKTKQQQKKAVQKHVRYLAKDITSSTNLH